MAAAMYASDDAHTAQRRAQYNTRDWETVHALSEAEGYLGLAAEAMARRQPHVPVLVPRIMAEMARVRAGVKDLRALSVKSVAATADPDADADHLIDLAGTTQTAGYTLSMVTSSRLHDLIPLAFTPHTLEEGDYALSLIYDGMAPGTIAGRVRRAHTRARTRRARANRHV